MDNNTLNLPVGTKIPDHIAIIPDGNRRWARARHLHTLQGHKAGFEMAMKLCRAMRSAGVHTVTLWGFSTGNWDRSEKEINYLMKLYDWLIDQYLKDANKEGVKLVHLGRKDRLPKFLIEKICFAEQQTSHNAKHIMNIAIDYGGHNEIVRAIKSIVEDNVDSKVIDEKLIEKYLDTKNQPYPYVDLMIRTSGEQRTSGLLLWQAEYAEYYWEDLHFPDFTPDRLKEAILDYSRRRRRFGGNDEIEHFSFKPEMVAKLEVEWWRLANIPEGTRFIDFSIRHLKEQFGLSKTLAGKAASLMVSAIRERNESKWGEAKANLKDFYKLIKGEIKLAFEPEIVASLEMKLWKDIKGKESVFEAGEVEDTARELYAEVYRISTLQAAKLAHLRVMAKIERNLAEAGLGDHHWVKAEDYLEKFYRALKDRIA